MLLCLERAHFAVVGANIEGMLRGQMGFADDAQQFLYEQIGLITVYANLHLKCKVCGTEHKGFEASSHLQTKEHLANRAALLQIATPSGDFCEGCPLLIQEENPYYDVVETVCRLGFCHKDVYDGGEVKLTYRIDEDLWRPDSCKLLVD